MTDAFSGVMGAARGLNDFAAGQRLDEVEAALATARVELARAVHGERTSQSRLAEVCTRLDEACEELSERDDTIDELRRISGTRRLERDCTRSALVRLGGDDRRVGPFEATGPWSRRQTYLANQTVECAGRVWVAALGAPPGAVPGTSGRWKRVPKSKPLDGHPVLSDADCEHVHNARQVPLAVEDPRPNFGHRVLFGREHWWDGEGRKWRLVELSDEHLANVLRYLYDRAANSFREDLAFQMATESASLLPCPPYAYAGSVEWLEDLPLVNALREEQRARVPGAAPPTNDDVQPTPRAASTTSTRRKR